MSIQWALNLLSGQWARVATSSTDITAGSLAVGSKPNAITALSSTLSGAITTLYPVIIAVAILFAGYWILKSLYHSRF